MVVRDRLKELQDKSKHYKGDFEEVEMKPLNPKQKSNTNMDQFFQASEEIAVGLSEIQKNIDKIRQLQKRVLNEPSKVERDKFQGELNDVTDVNKSLGAKVQRLIKNEIEANNKIEEKPGMSSQQLSELRIRKSQIATQSARYLEIWREYSNLQVEFREKAKAKLAKQAAISSASHLTEEEIEEKIDKGDISIFSSAIIQETAAAKEQLKAIENRHAEFLKLEKSIAEVHEMFIDVANLVENQGEMVTRIEDHINNAVIDVERGRENLGAAEKFKKAANRKKFICIALLVVLVIIILFIILFEFGAFSSSGGTTIVKEFHYTLPDGSKIIKDERDPELEKGIVNLGTETPSTTLSSTENSEDSSIIP